MCSVKKEMYLKYLLSCTRTWYLYRVQVPGTGSLYLFAVLVLGTWTRYLYEFYPVDLQCSCTQYVHMIVPNTIGVYYSGVPGSCTQYYCTQYEVQRPSVLPPSHNSGATRLFN